MSCDVAVALTEFRPSYKRATVMQASLAAVSFATGIATWLEGASLNWLIGSLLIGAVIPFTLIVISPIRDRKSTRLNSSHVAISYAVFCLKKKKHTNQQP